MTIPDRPNTPAAKPRLWTSSFIAACMGNFMLFFAFYLLLPILPLYLMEAFAVSKLKIGAILSSYTVAALTIRPFSGFILDKYPRKPVYLIAYLMFVLVFIGYAEATLLGLFVAMRMLHGLAFGMVTTAGNTVIIDIMPSERRGEGLGYFGIANNVAMAVGPMVSLFLSEHYSFYVIVYFALVVGLVGFFFASRITMPAKKPIQNPLQSQPQSEAFFDRFFLVKGLPAGTCLMLMAIPYGMMIGYISIYGNELGIETGMGVFFSLMAAGLVCSRLFSGKLVDQGFITQVICYGTLVCMAGLFLLSALQQLGTITWINNQYGFFLVPVLLGIGYGMMFPAYNTLFVNLAPHNRRATASSTYLTSWDVGIGFGLVMGGKLADSASGLPLAFFTGAVAASLSLLLFGCLATPHFRKNKLR